MAEADLSDQALEAGSVRGRGARAAKIIIDDDNLVAPPAEPAGAIRQTILEARRFPVLLNLAQGRLADVDNRVAIAMTGLDLLRRRLFNTILLRDDRQSPEALASTPARYPIQHGTGPLGFIGVRATV